MTPAPARRAAFDAVHAVLTGRADLPAALERARRHLPDARDRALAGEIATGTLRWLAALDHLIAHGSDRPIDQLDLRVLNVLRLSAYQITHLERVPPSAIVNDAVELTKRVGQRRAAGFVNAVLRALVRTRARPPLPPRPAASDRSRDAALDYLSTTLSHPRWLAARWLDRVGLEATETWARFNNTAAPMTLRVNTLKTTSDALRRDLAAERVVAEPTRYAPFGLVAREGNPLATSLAGSGQFIVQDEAAQLVTVFAGATAGETILDLCASPGNKTLGLLWDLRGAGVVVASDLRARRVALLVRTLRIGGAPRARVVRADALRPLPFGPRFDLVLLDAPCSGLGTIRRDPDIRWRRSPDDLPRFAAAQLQMLERAAEVVRPAGRLVYATCSSEPEENEDVVRAFLERHRSFRLADTPVHSRAGGLRDVLDASGCLRTLPAVHGLEAFYAAMLVRVKDL